MEETNDNVITGQPIQVPARKRRHRAGASLRGRTKPSFWPKPSEPVVVFWVHAALKYGHEKVLARFLREAQPVDPFVMRAIRRLCDRRRAGTQSLRLQYFHCGGRVGKPPQLPSCPVALANYLDPPPRWRGWRLEIKWKLDERKRQMAMEVEATRAEAGSTTKAVKKVAAKFRVSDATVWTPGAVVRGSRMKAGFAGAHPGHTPKAKTSWIPPAATALTKRIVEPPFGRTKASQRLPPVPAHADRFRMTAELVAISRVKV